MYSTVAEWSLFAPELVDLLPSEERDALPRNCIKQIFLDNVRLFCRLVSALEDSSIWPMSNDTQDVVCLQYSGAFHQMEWFLGIP